MSLRSTEQVFVESPLIWCFLHNDHLPFFPVTSLKRFISRSSHRGCSIKKSVLTNFAIFTGKHLCWSLFWIKLQAFIKKRLKHRSFPVYFEKIFRKPILKNIYELLLLSQPCFQLTIFLFALWISCFLLLMISCLLHFNRKIRNLTDGILIRKCV